MAANSWELTEKGLRKVYAFRSFTDLTNFLARLGPIADRANHHPDLRVFRAKHLEVYLITHDSGTITSKDEMLAKGMDELVQEWGFIPD